MHTVSPFGNQTNLLKLQFRISLYSSTPRTVDNINIKIHQDINRQNGNEMTVKLVLNTEGEVLRHYNNNNKDYTAHREILPGVSEIDSLN